MLRVVLFARIREQLGCDGVDVPWQAELATLSALESWLVDEHGDAWAEMLCEENLVRAVNHRVVSSETALADGDEIAFYPPVTGG